MVGADEVGLPGVAEAVVLPLLVAGHDLRDEVDRHLHGHHADDLAVLGHRDITQSVGTLRLGTYRAKSVTTKSSALVSWSACW